MTKMPIASKSNPKTEVMLRRFQRRNSGVITIYVALGLVAFLSVGALAVDMGLQYTQKADAQKAADAAALAGASNINLADPTVPFNAAKNYLKLNGYDVDADSSIKFAGLENPTDELGTAHPEWYRVKVSRPENLLFARIFGRSTGEVGAVATATAVTNVPQPGDPIASAGYGAIGNVTLSEFGPYGFYNNGDPWDVKFLQDGSPNPRYTGKGVNFNLNVSPDYLTKNGNQMQIELFDPDTFNANGSTEAATGISVDEIRAGQPGSTNQFTTTVYTLLKNGVPVDSQTYGNDPATDMQWVPAFKFTYDPTATYTLNVTTTDGSSENGFALRAGPQGATTFDPANGTSFAADGHLPINFDQVNGSTEIDLGFVPPSAAGGTVFIDKFDTDIGSTSVQYTVPNWPTFNQTGVLAGNGQWVRDAYTLPADYPGGEWFANYNASLEDTSAWNMSYTGSSKSGSVFLIR